MYRIILAALLFVGFNGPVEGGMEEVDAALERGDYATAYRELLPGISRSHVRLIFFRGRLRH